MIESTSTTAVPAPAPRRLIPIGDVVALVGLGRSAIYARIRAGTFPKPVSLGSTSSRWVESEVDAWIAGRIAERDAAA